MRALAALLLVAVTSLVASLAHAAPPHVVLISIDTLRADHVGAYGYAQPTSPFLDARAKDGLLFEHVLVPIPATTPSHGSMLTGVHPFVHGALSNATAIAPKLDTLAAAMKRRGYVTAGAVSVFHLRRKYGFAKGFDYYSEPSDNEIMPRLNHARPGSVTNGAAAALIARARREKPDAPLFLFVHYFDMHAPYGWWRNAPEPKTRQERIARYDENLRHVDALIGELLETLRARGIDDPLVFVTADHGEQLGEHGYDGGHADIYRETSDVPLIVWGPGVPHARVAANVSSLELAPAVAAAGGATLRNAIAKTNQISYAMSGRLATLLRSAPAAAPMIVTGYPTYTRSLLYAEGSYRLIRNFDFLYRDLVTSAAPPKPEGTELKAIGLRDDAVRFRLARSAYEPFVVTVDHYPNAAKCATHIAMIVDGAVDYGGIDRPANAPPMRLRFAAARLDEIEVRVSPAKCAGRVYASIARMQRPDELHVTGATTTAIYAGFLTQRKLAPNDELYDIASDPGMTRNRIADAALQPAIEAMRRRMRELYTQLAASRKTTDVQYTSEELKKLRSLGYIH
ncbi:MAG TPA: sulfatase [Thermoanaerobaculia bacterium]|jgi:arylsulfatase A-like enzyme